MRGLSLNEFEVTCRKACVGAGIPDGVAAILARAALWLERRGHAGAEALVAGLKADAGALAKLPGQVGLCLADGTATTGPVPPLLAGGVCAVVMPRAATVRMEWAGGEASVSTDTAQITGGTDAFAVIELRVAPADMPDAPALAPRVHPPDQAWNDLRARAHETMVPATEQSRAAGAGAGDIDND